MNEGWKTRLVAMTGFFPPNFGKQMISFIHSFIHFIESNPYCRSTGAYCIIHSTAMATISCTGVDLDDAGARTIASPRIVLGSESKWRRRLLADAGLVFDTASPSIDEKAISVGLS